MPFQSVEAEMKKYKNAQVTWCQEEHKNQGAYYYLEPRLRSTMRHVGSKQDEVDYVGRAPSASTSAGLFITHKKELEAFLKDAMN
jgi:2-oxoglutarate dehydrogenase E1 component